MYQLYYYPNNASLAPHFLLHHVSADYELVLVDKHSNAQKTPDYLKLNPAGRIPTLVKDGQAIFESAAICVHLCELHPEAQLIPCVGDPLRPVFFQWLMFLTNTLQAELMGWYYPHRYTMNEESIPDVVAAQEVQIANALAVIDQQLSKTQYLVGDSLTACDYFLFMLAEWSLVVPQNPMTFSNLSKYLNRLSRLPTIEAVCRLEEIDLSPFH